MHTLYAISVASLRVLSLCTSSLLSIIIFIGWTQKSFIWKWTKTENIKLVLKIKKAIKNEPSQKDCVLCKCFAQSLSVASPAPLTLSPSEPNSLCVLGSLPQIDTLERFQTWVTAKIHTYSRPSRQQKYLDCSYLLQFSNQGLTCIPWGVFQSINQHIGICRATWKEDKNLLEQIPVL